MNRLQAEAFARDWIAAWGAHDLGRILSHYTDDFETHSPYIPAIVGGDMAVLAGKTNVAEYWGKALQAYPELNFELLHVWLGEDSVVLVSQGVRGLAAEAFFFNSDRHVYRAHAHYGK